MVIHTTEQVSPEVIKISSDTGLAFFIRTTYLILVKPEDIVQDAVFEDESEKDIIDAGLTYGAEIKAVDYLARCEQSRFGLTQKLLKKNHEKQYIEKALDYLEGKNYLSDRRFATAWLNSRKINHSEGRVKLTGELASRGIGKEIIKTVLDEYFEENSEESLCRRDYEKQLRTCKDEEKIIRRLMAHGFNYSVIKKVISEVQ